MDSLSAGELAALDQSNSEDAAVPIDTLAEAPATAPPLWRAEAHAWTPRAHHEAVLAASGPVCFSYISLPTDEILPPELPAPYRAVRAGGVAVRTEAALDSEPAGRIVAGEVVGVTERVEVERGDLESSSEHDRVMTVRLRTELGWVSEKTNKGHTLMMPTSAQPPIEVEISSLVRDFSLALSLSYVGK